MLSLRASIDLQTTNQTLFLLKDNERAIRRLVVCLALSLDTKNNI